MFCNQCGGVLSPGAAYCPKCGATVTGAVPAAAPHRRVESNYKLLGILWLVAAVLLLPGAMVLLGIAHFRTLALFAGDVNPFAAMPAFIGPLLAGIGAVLLLGAVIGFVVGIGLLNLAPWARMAAIVLGIVMLLHFPFGTALGIFTLWVLLPSESDAEYRSLAAARQSPPV